MTDPIRAALERLIARLDETTDPSGPVPAWSDSFYAARAALAQSAPPADGDEGRQPSGYAYRYQSLGSSVIRFNGGGEVNGSRPVEAIPYWLGRPPQPVPPAEGEVGELVNSLRHSGDALRAYGLHGGADDCTRAADLLEQRHPAPVPVPVSERLPGHVEQALIKAECALSDIAEGEPEENEGDSDALLSWAEQRAAAVLARIRPVMREHGIRTSEWSLLPAHSLPLPAGEVQP